MLSELPPGLSFDSALARITGTPQVSGTFPLNFETSGSGASIAQVTLFIDENLQTVPKLVSPAAVRSRGALDFQITGTPGVTRFAATDLPPGVSIEPATGRMIGAHAGRNRAVDQ